MKRLTPWFNTFSQGLKYNIEIVPSYWRYLTLLLFLLINLVLLQQALDIFTIKYSKALVMLAAIVFCFRSYRSYATAIFEYLVLYENGNITMQEQHFRLTRGSRITPLGCSLTLCPIDNDGRLNLCKIATLQALQSKHLFIFKDSVDEASYARLCRVIKRLIATPDAFEH